MTTVKPNPFLNAVLAFAYIVGIVFVIQAFTAFAGFQQTLTIPIGMLGLLVLSVATMGYLFTFEPLRLCFENKREEASVFFLKTLGSFAGILFIYFIYVFTFLR